MNEPLKFAFGLCLMVTTAISLMPTIIHAKDSSSGELISLLDVAPAAYYGLKRMPKFYSDPNMDTATVDGSLTDRQYLLGSLGGARTSLADHGLVFDAGLTQVVQGAVSGDGDSSRYVGSLDVWGALDTGRAGLWSGGLVIAHFEGDWGDPVGGTGVLLPVNGDAIMPAGPTSFALSELYIVQGLPAGFSLLAGKADFAGLADKSFFANDERNQFLYEGLINDPILGSFIPYTTLGASVSKQFGKDFNVAAVVASNDNSALAPGFDSFGLDAMTYALAATWTPTFGSLPGTYNLLVGYSTKDTPAFDLDERYLLGELVGLVPVVEEDGNYALAMGGTQYVWVDEGAKRSDGLPVGYGIFARAGFAPSDRNVIDQFYSVGIGGFGGPFSRHDDNWGVGWAATHISTDFRRDAGVLGFDVASYEHAVEAYYNVALTPAVRLSGHVQWINPAAPDRDDAVVLAARLQLDF